jgi:phage baseplate assembly protein W
MAGISVKLPLTRDEIDGFYALNKNHREMIRQNLKHLILTTPGERMMDPFFGVGLRNFLFENDIATLQDQVVSKINEQVNFYMPFVRVLEVNFYSDERNVDNFSPNVLGVVINYEIIPLKESYALEINV